jgi:hypothetical protein
MFAKLVNRSFFTDMRPLRPADRADSLTEESLKAAFVRVEQLIERIPGAPWTRADEMRERFGLGPARS